MSVCMVSDRTVGLVAGFAKASPIQPASFIAGLWRAGGGPSPPGLTLAHQQGRMSLTRA
ncbi:hypothetical protein D3C72_884030 [compost metagenome]